VEQAVLAEFRKLAERGGVLGAMEMMYQRNQIQDESLYYEMRKHTGELPIIGVNTYLGPDGSPTVTPSEVIRSEDSEKQRQIDNTRQVEARGGAAGLAALEALRVAARSGGNVFDSLLEAAQLCSLGQMTGALYQVGGQYRRNM
jgi:isobutyryl-CoA mutase